MIKYSLNLFLDIKNKNTYNIPLSIIEEINIITNLVNAPTYNKTPEIFDKYKKKKKQEINDNQSISFTRTIITKQSGINNEINILRILINKLTNNSYTLILNNIKKHILYVENNYSIIDCNILAVSLFDMLINNLTFSNLYASLLSELQIHSFIQSILQTKINCFLNLFTINNDIIYQNNISFDEISIINKNLDKEMAMALLFVNLFKLNIIEKDIIINFINKLFNIFFELINIENKTLQIHHLSNIIFILIKNSFLIIKNEEIWKDIIYNINSISIMKQNIYLSNKTIFKFMDLKDVINI